MVLNCPRVNDRSGWIISTLLGESSHWVWWGGFVCLEETTVVVLNESVSASSICPVVGTECIRFYLCARDSLCMLPLEYTCRGNTVNWTLLEHGIFICLLLINLSSCGIKTAATTSAETIWSSQNLHDFTLTSPTEAFLTLVTSRCLQETLRKSAKKRTELIWTNWGLVSIVCLHWQEDTSKSQSDATSHTLALARKLKLLGMENSTQTLWVSHPLRQLAIHLLLERRRVREAPRDLVLWVARKSF